MSTKKRKVTNKNKKKIAAKTNKKSTPKSKIKLNNNSNKKRKVNKKSRKSIKNIFNKQYNKIKKLFLAKKKKKKTSKKVIKKNSQNDDELMLLHYQDYKGLNKIKVFFKNRIRVIKFDMKRFKKRLKYGTLRDKILIVFMMLLIAGVSAIIAFCVYIVVTAPEINNERLYKTNSSVFLDANGEVFARRGAENREKVTYDELPEVLVDAIVSAEDSRFFQHNGIDIARFSKAVVGQLMGRSDAGGGSTLTMQVSKNAATSTEASGIAGIIRKFQDIYLAVFVFEKQYTKEQIMEFYVNIPYLGSGTYGVEQASKAYFGKNVSELSLVEAATIAGLFQAPDSYDPTLHPVAAENRRNTILNLMYRHGYITEEERDAAKSVPIKSTLVEQKSTGTKYQDFIDTVIEEVKKRTKHNPMTESMTIYTTMNPKKQDVVNGIINGETYSWANDKAQAGIAVISVKDGSLVAVGASRSKAELSLNFATQDRNHPGSTAKPILDYGPAIEYLNWSTGTTVIDDKYTYTGGGQIKNFDNGFKGVMMVKTALAQSRNIPALYTFQQTTNEQKLEFSNNLGWHAEDATNYIVESAAIGGFDGITPLESAAAYATFARGGTYIEPYSFTKIEFNETGETYTVTPKKIEAMSEETAYMITMVLKYAVTSGSVGAGSVSGTDIAAKTGTSTIDSAAKKAAGIKGNVIGDSWEVAYSPDYAISTWYGYQKLEKDAYLTGTEGGNARKKITKLLTAGILEKNSRFSKPSGVVTAEIELGTDPLELASTYTPDKLKSTEYFKKGTVPNTTSSRFAQLENPSDLKYTSTATQVTLNWKAAPTPDAINQEYLKEYFNNNVYKKWADKYLQERIDYNNKTFGAFGYQLYLINSNGTIDLGFTTNTTFTTNTIVDENTKFVVKSAYQYFKTNQSKGIEVKVNANDSNIQPETNVKQSTTVAQTSNLSIEYIGPSCSTVDTYNALGSSPSNKIKVIADGQDVTNKANIRYASCEENGNEIDCPDMIVGKEYKVTFTITYNNITRNKSITLKASCN